MDEETALTEAMPHAFDPKEGGFPMVCGHRVTSTEWRAFEVMVLGEGKTVKEIVAQLTHEGFKITIWALSWWRRQDWWKQMVCDNMRDSQETFLAILSKNAPALANGMVDVAKGTHKDDRTASARVNAAKVFMEAGTEPIINRRPQVQITHNTQTNVLTLDPSKYHEMSAEEVFAHARGEKLTGGE